tara:strand:+ start:352 stop:567 length:216 start_codon:yes stop_codon:yes gene_type:complete
LPLRGRRLSGVGGSVRKQPVGSPQPGHQGDIENSVAYFHAGNLQEGEPHETQESEKSHVLISGNDHLSAEF